MSFDLDVVVPEGRRAKWADVLDVVPAPGPCRLDDGTPVPTDAPIELPHKCLGDTPAWIGPSVFDDIEDYLFEYAERNDAVLGDVRARWTDGFTYALSGRHAEGRRAAANVAVALARAVNGWVTVPDHVFAWVPKGLYTPDEFEALLTAHRVAAK